MGGSSSSHTSSFQSLVTSNSSSGDQNSKRIPEDDAWLNRIATRQNLSLDSKISFSVAVCGQMKSGKSRFINAIRGVDKNAEDYAPVGENDVPTDVKKYEFRDHDLSHIWLFDVPGSGRRSECTEDYFKENKLVAFECVLIFIGPRIRDEDVQLAKIARKYGIPFKFVLSYCDLRIRNHAYDHAIDTETAKKNFIKMTTAFTRKKLYEKGDLAMSQAKLIFISSTVFEDPNKYNEYRIDEDYLLRYITTQVPLEEYFVI